MSIPSKKFAILTAAALLLLAAQRPSLAGSATWSQTPTSDDWNTAANWTPNTVPNSSSDIATFGASNVTNLFIDSSVDEVDRIVFDNSAPAYTISVEIYNLFLSGLGIVNNSEIVQSFVTPTTGNNYGAIYFSNGATAGNLTNFSSDGGFITFNDSSSAGSAVFDLTDGATSQAQLFFWDSTSAGNATITASLSALVGVYEDATAANATFTLNNGAALYIADRATGDHAVATCAGGQRTFGSSIAFQDYGSAGEGYYSAVGGSSNEAGGVIEFDGDATAENGTFVVNGGMGAGLLGCSLTFEDSATAAASRITAKGGKGGSEGGEVIFTKTSTGGTASITLTGNAELDLSTHKAPGVTIGSLAGKGSVLLGANTLTIGSNNQSTAFSGVISGTGGVTKSGSGTLTLSGNNTYTGPTAVKAGVLLTNNKQGSATGSGSVNVNAGTLGGQGALTGSVTLGTGSGSGAFLAPSVAAKQPTTLSLASALTFNADATYTCALQASKKKSANDEVVANGVTIASGAQFNLVAIVQGKLKAGVSSTVISNTASTRATGTFANLADGAVLTVGNTKLQASYEGGDGNDLTLTVVP
ncbi:MAG TPA: autotransporter-associated beta strand repeat-containing protein [Chthoniobacterales bacterium]